MKLKMLKAQSTLKKTLLVSLVLALAVLTMAGCGGDKPADKPADKVAEAAPVELYVSAAASLTDCMQEMATVYQKTAPNVKLTYNFGASGALQQQIEQGAPADVFLSAGKKQMTALQDKDLMVADSVRDILINRVVLITPKKDGLKLADFNALAGDEVKKIGVGEPGSVPVGQYTGEIFTNLQLTDQVKDKLVFAKDVREVLSWTQTGNVDAGIVYETDAKITDDVVICAIAPEDSHKKVIYPCGVVKASKNAEAAKAFQDFLFTDAAKQVFEKYGFTAAF